MKTSNAFGYCCKGAFGPLLFIFVLCGCLLQPATVLALGGKPQTVGYVYDGDTLRLTNGDVVRLAGIDAPEFGHKGMANQYYAENAYDALRGLVLKKNVIIKPVGNKKDRFGRVLALVYLTDGRLVQDILLANGLAFCLFYSDQPEQLQERLLQHQRRAIRDNAGFWPEILALSHVAKGVIGNVRSKRFGQTRCAALRHVSQRNRVFFESVRDAFVAGYAPYRQCGFWPDD